MITRKHLIKKIKSLSEDKFDEVADFIDFLEAKDKGQSELTENGMGDYLNQLLIYEEMLANGKIEWK